MIINLITSWSLFIFSNPFNVKCWRIDFSQDSCTGQNDKIDNNLAVAIP